MTVSQLVSLGVQPHLGLMTRYLLLFASYGLVLCGALSYERAGLSFIYAAGPRQRSLSRVRVPPTTRRVTVEVFEPASTLQYFIFNVTMNHLHICPHLVSEM
jgi:hypothetical protein